MNRRIVGAVTAVLLWLCTLSPAALEAQTTTGIVRGYVRGPGGDVAGATVVARNTETNQRRQVSSTENGFYILPGLRPGPYEITVTALGFGTQRRGLQLLVGQTVDANFDLGEEAVALEALSVTAPAVETRTSEVATNVTREQIEGLPTADRNFLGLAVLAPGTRLQDDRLDGTRKTFTAGAQPAEQVNVFIDGASYKNDLLQGGVAGQDASRGNPFPRNAIREFRIITQNFKAEYQKASSAIITATTRSGTNRWETDGFLNYQDRGLVELDRFQSRDRQNNPNFTRPDYDRVQAGANVGGPIIADRLHFFGSFERNVQNRAKRVEILPPSGYPALDTIDFASRNGEFDEPFRATLLFGKLTFEHTPSSFFELSYHGRHENDVRDFGGNTAYEAATRFKNDVHTGILKHTWTRGNLLNEATASLQDYFYNPQPNEPGPINRLFGFGCCAQIGGFVSDQDFRQLRASVRNDLTWSGLRWAGEHVVKGGVNVDFLDYDVVKRNSETPRFVYEPWYFGFAFPNKVEFQTGDPSFGARNTQLGLYLQDDWSPTGRLVLNLGVRWDFETHMMNYDYETPGAVVDSLTKYQDRLFLPLDPDRYFTDGDDRKPFYGAIQPRLGFSLALDSEARTSVFGGWGIFYDRTLFDHALEEAFALQHPSYTLFFAPPGGPVPAGQVEWDERYFDRDELLALIGDRRFNTPEIKLLPNDLRPPKAQHFNLGVRRAFGSVEASASYNAVRSKNIMTFYWADQGFVCPQRAFGVPNCFENRDIPGWGSVLFADDAGRTWYDALQIKVDRPYTRSAERRWGWGAGLAVTVAERETQGFNDLFSFAQAVDYPRQVRNDEPLRIVGNWVVDLPFAGGLQFSGLLNLGSGTRQDVGGRADSHNPNTVFEPGGFEPGTEPFLVDAFAYRMLDVRFRKDFVSFRGSRIGVAADVFNVFNFDNLGCFNTFNREDPNFGRAGCTISDPRRLQIGVEYRAGGR